MKTKKFFLLGLLAATLSLAGCGKDSDSNSNSNGGQDYQDDPNLSLVENLKNRAKPIAANLLNKSESSITFADFEDEEAEADIYYYDSSTLTFVVIVSYKDSYDSNYVNTLKSYIPSDAKLVKNDDDLEYAEYGMEYYDRYYTSGQYTYDIYVEAYDEFDWGDGDVDPAETYGSIYIYKTSQQNAFDAFMSEE